MSKYVINDTTLTAIGDAVRSKSGTSDLIPVSGLADAITNLPSGGGGGGELEPIVITDGHYGFAGVAAKYLIEAYGRKVSTLDLTSGSYMFTYNPIESVPFEINFSSNTTHTLSYMFNNSGFKVLPKCNGVKPAAMDYLFSGCDSLRTIEQDYFDNWDFSDISSNVYANWGSQFRYCYSLREFPMSYLNNACSATTSHSCSIYNYLFYQCHSLDEIIDLPIPYTSRITSNIFRNTFDYCGRVKNITFKTNEDGTPIVVNWSNQTINLNTNQGYTSSLSSFYMTDYNSGITEDKKVKDDATYQALKNDPDWFAVDPKYSRYNHDSAVNTINSLPDTAAGGGSNNTIIFKRDSGSKTDGGAISSLTDAELAVAIAKGWTVSLSL